MEKDCSPYAFTGRFTMFRNRIVSDIILCSPDEGNPNAIRVRALWDTGCSNSVISSRTAEFLRLKLGRTLMFRTAFGGQGLKPLAESKICVVLGGMRIPLEVGVDEKPNTDPDCDITLGLDFISQGDFAFTHTSSGRLCLSFCYPPVGAETDFTLIATKFSQEKVVADEVEINESAEVEGNRRKLLMLDYYEELACAKREREAKEAAEKEKLSEERRKKQKTDKR